MVGVIFGLVYPEIVYIYRFAYIRACILDLPNRIKQIM